MSLEPAKGGLKGGKMTWEILPPHADSERSRARLIGKCVVTGELHSMECDGRAFAEYLIKATFGTEPVIQEAFPDMKPEDREFIVSGISPEGWKRCFDDQQQTKGKAWRVGVRPGPSGSGH